MSSALTPERVAALLETAVEGIGGVNREGQLAMAEAVATTIDSGSALVVQAGTGTGKSLAYLTPAIGHVGAGGGPVVVATATLALQHQLVGRDLPAVIDALEPMLDRRPDCAVLKGRSNYLCIARLTGEGEPQDAPGDLELFDAAPSAAAQGRLEEQAAVVRDWAESTETGDRDELGSVDARVWRAFSVTARECPGAQRCPVGDDCWAEKAREQANQADIVITNHALLALDLLQDLPVLPAHDSLIVDEAHELADRATAAVTDELTMAAVSRAKGRARTGAEPELLDRWDQAETAYSDAIRRLAFPLDGPVRLAAVEGELFGAVTMLRDVCSASLAQMRKGADSEDADSAPGRQQARAAVEEVQDVAGKLLSLGANDVAWVDPGFGSRQPALYVAPLSVADQLGEKLFDQRGVVLTSATLTLGGEFDPFARAVGLEPGGFTAIDVGSPFRFAEQGILYVAAHLDPPGREHPSAAALDELTSLVTSLGGRSLVLCSSWRGVERAEEALAAALGQLKPEPRLIVQRKGDAVATLVREFADDPTSVLLGTMSLWQGVDVPGDSCALVVIDRVPFPRPDDPVLAARSEAVDAAGGSGFMAVSVPRAGLLLAQAAGRLIRSDADRGVVAVLDSRLHRARYGSYLRASLPPLWYTTDRAGAQGALTRLGTELSATGGTPEGDAG